MVVNKSDIILFITIIIVFLLSSYFLFFVNKSVGNKAIVLKNSDIILEIDLTSKESLYVVEGELGPVKISAGNGHIKVIEESSPYHLCSKQGYIEHTYETIVCLPNKIIIEIISTDKDELDTVVR